MTKRVVNHPSGWLSYRTWINALKEQETKFAYAVVSQKAKEEVIMMSIEEKKKKRLEFLHRLYELSGGNQATFVNMFDICKELGLDRASCGETAQYLQEEGLVKLQTLDGHVSITHLGIVKVEGTL
ncbi:MAG: MarR family transcriptional regulator [candidate division Zixibacteria bacterium]|nr:MarR family transcriptional regulator [candidate division Zixibacteria bacterium]